MNGGWQFNGTPGNTFAESAQGYGAYIEGGYYLTPMFAIGGFANSKALSRSEDPKKASIPFNVNRNGFVMGSIPQFPEQFQKGWDLMMLADFHRIQKDKPDDLF